MNPSDGYIADAYPSLDKKKVFVSKSYCEKNIRKPQK